MLCPISKYTEEMYGSSFTKGGCGDGMGMVGFWYRIGLVGV